MSHRTQVIQTSKGYAGICSCGFHTEEVSDRSSASIAINDHYFTAIKKGVKVTHLEEDPKPPRR